MSSVSRGLALLGAGALSLSCATSTPAEKPATATAPEPQQSTAPTPPKAQPRYGSFGFDTAGMDTSVAPGDDFFRYSSGKWDETTEIPADKTGFGMFTVLADEAEKRNRALIEEAAKSSAAPGSEERKLADVYNAFMDEAAIESKGLSPLKPELDRIAALQTNKELATLLGEGLRADVDALNTGDVETDRPFAAWVTPDLNQPSRYTVVLLQGGLSLPDRDYYLVENPRFAEVRQKYQAHIAAMLKLAGIDQPEKRAKRIYDLEKKIAQLSWTQVDTRDVQKTNNPWKKSDFAKKAPGLDWDAYLGAAGLGAQQDFIVWQPSAASAMSKLIASEPLEAWKDYLTFHAVARAAPYLPKAFVDESFAFNGKTLVGAQEQRARWKRALAEVDANLGDALGKLYIAKYFPPEAKREADIMVRNIVAAFGDRIDALEWMAPETKARAREKLQTLRVGIGHPERWTDYSQLEVRPDDAYGNHLRAEKDEYRRQLSKLGTEVFHGEWFMVPQLVNALNSPQLNAIIFPAAILQPPFFDAHADPAVNYGGIGSVIGHEIVHSFDDMGAQFDAKGKLSNWWTKEDLAQFKKAGESLIAQYNAYKPLPDLSINGDLTLGENIADVAGIAIALDGYHQSLGDKPAPVIEGFTGDQRFYLGFAQVWRSKYREPMLRRRLLTDGHAPGPYRARTVRNTDEWYQAFDVKEGQQLFLTPEQRVRVW